ncbi:MAG: valine--tRNA ligase [Bacteriovoracia bacterium]
MEKSYNPEKFETNIYTQWEASKAFGAEDQSPKPAFMIAMPPPNVTGALHNGHALFVTIQDLLTRWKRMKGFNTLWLPGMDHAGIATQMVVERELAKEKKSKHDLGREKFVQTVWDWKEKHGGIIINQMKKLGASPDWSRSRFTMDEGLSAAVREVFVSLYEEGLIYRGTRLINWCTRCQTALSDLEVVPKEMNGSFWHIKYGDLVIATTRPETLLGDTAVAVHPEDDRYKSIVGKTIKVPLVGRAVPVIADSYADKDFGSGALKVTPGHDFNDYELGKKHKLQTINVFTKDGKIAPSFGSYQGLSIPDARKKIVEDLEAQGLLVKTEPHKHHVGVCQRCERVVEPMISEQWFLNVKPMAEKSLEVVRRGQAMTLQEVDEREDAIKIVPDFWNATFYHWMENIQDWCISRQLWWGHQIPAWYCKKCSSVCVSRENLEACSKCQSNEIVQDEDVLDTWFSSALWPFSTLGWPDKTQALKTFYPNSVMETGTDILFFWVARMIMMGIKFNDGRVPFKRVYLHALVRDEKGQKMSKTKGNVIDPLDIIKDFGADAFRFTLVSLSGQGRDIKLSLDRVENNKAFCNKLWNASRYVLARLGYVTIEGISDSNDEDFKADLGWVKKNHARLHPINKWILSRLSQAVEKVEKGFEEFRLNDSAQELYAFVWNEFCDWYIEFSKELLNHDQYREETKQCLLYVLDQTLRLSHPFIPFISEEIHTYLRKNAKLESRFLMLQKYPDATEAWRKDEKAQAQVDVWRDVISQIRNFRGENNISPKARPDMTFEVVDNFAGLEAGVDWIRAVAQLNSFEKETGKIKKAPDAAEIISKSAKLYVKLTGLVDVEGEIKRLQKEKNDTQESIQFVKTKLSKPSFVEKAPKELVEEEKQKLTNLESKVVEIMKSISKLEKMRS